MLVTVTLEGGTSLDARDLSHLMRKHPAKVQAFNASVGTVHVFYPEVAPERTTVAMLLEVDPIALVRNKSFRGDAGSLDHYVNDRPYAASSLLSVAIATVFSSAMGGTSEAVPELAAARLPLRIVVPVASVRGDEPGELPGRLFAPLGWAVDFAPIPLDETRPEWGNSRYGRLTLTGRVTLAHALRQLYVLLPVLDDAKHYWVGEAEAEKLARRGEGWLPDHPERELIAQRYLAHQRTLVALAQEGEEVRDEKAPVPLKVQRAEAVMGALADVRARRVVDMGSGPGALLRRLKADASFTAIVGVDVSARALERARAVLRLDEASDAERERITLLHGSVVYRDDRLRGYDAMVLMEVIEHVDESRLAALEDAVFGWARPSSVIVTTPNRDHNALFPGLPEGALRHDDHRFEFSREEFGAWARGVAERHGYAAEFRPVGPDDPQAGPATQMAVFRKDPA